MTTAGCAPQSRACDCHWKTAYWSIFAADRNHHAQTVLIGLKITVIIGFGCDLFVTRNTALHGLCTVDFSNIYHNGYKTPQQAETPSVTYHVYEIWFRMTVQWISHCAASSILRVGSIWACVTHPLQHSASASVCVSCWVAGISVRQLAVSRCLRHLVGSAERKSMGLCWLDRDQSGLYRHSVTAEHCFTSIHAALTHQQ